MPHRQIQPQGAQGEAGAAVQVTKGPLELFGAKHDGAHARPEVDRWGAATAHRTLCANNVKAISIVSYRLNARAFASSISSSLRC